MIQLPEFMEPLLRLGGGFPEEAVRETLRRKEEATPILLSCLEEIADSPDSEEWDSDFILLDFAMVLLAQFRETRALEPILRIARSREANDLLGDFITETLPAVLASTCGGNARNLIPLLEDRTADEFARSSGLAALGCLYHAEVLDRSSLIALLTECYTDYFEEKPGMFWDEWVSLVGDFRLKELMEFVARLYQKGLADPGFQTLEEVRKDVRESSRVPHYSEEHHEYRLIEDTVAEMSWWACFYEEKPVRERAFNPGQSVRPAPVRTFSPVTYVRDSPKIGRNDPCPCGSGKKFKKCCGKLE